MMRSRIGDAALAALATITAAWPLSTLLESPIWVQDVLLLLAVVVLSGAAGRALSLRGWQVLVLQLIVTALAVSGLYGRGHLWHGLPTPEMAGVFGGLTSEAIVTVQTHVAPAPTTRGLLLVVGTLMALAGILVDYLAVTRRAPSLAGLPLLALFLGSAANSGSSLNPVFFLTAAGMWLLLVARQGTSLLRRWSTTVATPLTPVRDSDDRTGVAGYAAIARSLGIGALLLAVVLPVALPHLPTRFLLSGLGRNDEGPGGGSSRIGFSQSLDLSADLKSRSTAPVLTYRSSDPAPPPLRVGVSSRYSRGLWPGERPSDSVSTSRQPAVPPPPGLSDQVPKRRYSISVEDNNLLNPDLAVPYPLAGADLFGVRWGLDRRTQQVVVATAPRAYTAEYWRLEPGVQTLRNAVEVAETPHEVGAADLLLDRRSGATVRNLTEQVTAESSTSYDRAMAIQEYLRSTGGFTYSLTLAPPVTDASGNDVGLDPISNFLTTRKGYCVQFATAMIMMARASGIPARMATGFMPGTQSQGRWTVLASNAHAWPELYFQGVGWTRFEPTPSVRSGLPPAYAIPQTSGGGAGGGRAQDEGPLPSQTTGPRDNTVDRGLDLVAPVDVTPVAAPRWTALFRGWGLVALSALLVILGGLVVPMAGQRRRRSRLRAARTEAELVEAQWRSLTSRLSDLGLPPGPSSTPRQMHQFYAREAFLDESSSQALGRVVQTLERARYAPPDGHAGTGIEPDARSLVRAVARSRPRRVRLRATMWPSSGVEQVRSFARRTGWRVRGPWQDAAASVRQRLRRRN